MQSALIIDAGKQDTLFLKVNFEGSEVEVVGRVTIDHCIASLNSNSGAEEDQSQLISEIQSAVNSLGDTFDTTAFILPPLDYLSLSLTLPFTKPSELQKLLAMELQDVVPFNLDEVAVDAKTINQRGGSLSEVHAAIVSKNAVLHSLNLLNAAGVDPIIVVSKTSIFDPVFSLSNSPETTLGAYRNHDALYLSARVGGRVHLDRIRPITDREMEHESLFDDAVSREIALLRHTCEKRFEKNFNQLLIIGSLDKKIAESEEDLEINSVSLTDLVNGAKTDREGFAAAACRLLPGLINSPPLSNFRVGELKVKVDKKLLRDGLLKLLAPLWLLLGIALICLVALFISRHFLINQIDNATKQIVTKAIPETSSAQDATTAVQLLRAESSKLSAELGALGVVSDERPLRILEKVVDTFPTKYGTLTKISIEEGVIQTEGLGKTFESIRSIREAFERSSRRFFCGVQETSTGARSFGASRGDRFSLRMKPCGLERNP